MCIYSPDLKFPFFFFFLFLSSFPFECTAHEVIKSVKSMYLRLLTSQPFDLEKRSGCVKGAVCVLSQEDPEIPFSDEDYRMRRAHPNFKKHIDLEKLVVKMGKTVGPHLKSLNRRDSCVKYLVCDAVPVSGFRSGRRSARTSWRPDFSTEWESRRFTCSSRYEPTHSPSVSYTRRGSPRGLLNQHSSFAK